MAKNTEFTPLIDHDGLMKGLEGLQTKRKALQAELTEIDREIQAGLAYMDIRQGKPYGATYAAPLDKAPTPSSDRESTGFRKEIEEHVKAAGAGGLFSSQVSKHFNPSKDDKLQSRINAALHNLKKQGKLRQETRNAQYIAAEFAEPTERETPAATTSREEEPELAEQEAE
jgi:hypothetical protein